MTPESAYQYLLDLPRFEKTTQAYKPGLEKIRRILQQMGDPHLRYPTAHIAGTNGKGSVSSMTAAIGTASGKQVGLYTSPHLFHFTERFRINGIPASPEWMAQAVAHWKPLFDIEKPSFFEATTALAFTFFAEMKVDAAVIETGLGGRLDATNVVAPVVTAITNIGFDHMAQLGETLPEIAREKAGIIKPNTPVFTTVFQPEIRQIMEAHAASLGAIFHELLPNEAVQNFRLSSSGFTADFKTPYFTLQRLKVALPGEHQRGNALLALCCAKTLFPSATTDEARKGLGSVVALSGLRGRCEVRSRNPLIVADVGHNADGLAATMRFVRFLESRSPLYVIFGCMKDKDLKAIARIFESENVQVFTVNLPPPRGYDAQSLAVKLEHLGIKATPHASVPEALRVFMKCPSENKTALVTGSHQVVAEMGATNDFFSI